MDLDASKWSGEGTFTQTVIDGLKTFAAIELVRVEDAPASRTDALYNFISNEIYVRFRAERSSEPSRLLGIIPARRTVLKPVTSLEGLHTHLTGLEGIGAPDYSDEGMLQYLRTERIIPPYQTRGFKIVEMVRIYELTA
jgi:hypothetical protein